MVQRNWRSSAGIVADCNPTLVVSTSRSGRVKLDAYLAYPLSVAHRYDIFFVMVVSGVGASSPLGSCLRPRP